MTLIGDVASIFKSDVHLLFVKTEEHEGKNYEMDSKDMKTVFKQQQPKLNFITDMIEEDDVVEGINAYAKKESIDMVVVVTKHRHFWERALHSSVTKELQCTAKFLFW